MPFIQRRGVNIFYREEGAGSVVLLLHGFPDTSEVWRSQIQALTQSGFKVVAPDLRGFGRSSKPKATSAYSLSEIAEDVLFIVDKMKVERFYLAGHDWGATVAWGLAVRCPQRVISMAVLSVGHPAAFLTRGGLKQRQKSWYFLFFQKPEAEELLKANNWALWRNLVADEKPEIVNNQIKEMSQKGALTAEAPSYLSKLDVHVLGIWSSRDDALTEEQMKGSADFVRDGKFRYKRVDGAGHWLQLETPQAINEALINYFTPISAL